MNYNFLMLSPYEFECLSRDVLQKHLGIYLESFTQGRDKGIDLRYTENKENKIIIQTKRYEKYSDLLSNLKKEVKKVMALCPSRYILVTSVGLTPDNKEAIMNLFYPYINETKDVIGRDELNNLLSFCPEIEKQNFKLWLSSVNILEMILNKRIHNQSQLELSEIRNNIKYYVPNDSVNEALDILREFHYVIISGVPGIGKTTLARILIYHLLGNGYEEFVYLESMGDANSSINNGISQLFFYDDFLGANELEIANRFDSNLVKLINWVQSQDNKLLILTTREHILSQAKNESEIFERNGIDIAKCVVDVAHYTDVIKAKILYNHLSFANIPHEYLNDLLEFENYNRIICHKNYSPRIIEVLVKQAIWRKCKPNEFADRIVDLFDNPQAIWKFAFNHLDKFAQFALYTLVSMTKYVLLIYWENAFRYYIEHSKLVTIDFSEQKWIETLDYLENSFIKIDTLYKSSHVVCMHNPSIRDFLVYNLEQNPQIIDDMLRTISCIDQSYMIWGNGFDVRYRIKLNAEQIEILINRVKEIWDDTYTCEVARAEDDGRIYGWIPNLDDWCFSVLAKLHRNYGNQYPLLDDYIIAKLDEVSYTEYYFTEEEQLGLLYLLGQIDITRLHTKVSEILESLFDYLDNYEALIDFFELESAISVELKKFLRRKPKYVVEIVDGIISTEIKFAASITVLDNVAFDLYEYTNNLRSLKLLNLDIKKYELCIQKKRKELKKNMRLKKTSELRSIELKEESNEQIKDIFQSLGKA